MCSSRNLLISLTRPLFTHEEASFSVCHGIPLYCSSSMQITIPGPPKHPKWPLSKTRPGYSLTWQMNKTKQDSSIAQLSVWDHISNVDVHIVCFNTPWRTHINTLTFHSCLINTLQRQKEFPTLNHRKAVGLMLSRWKLSAKNKASVNKVSENLKALLDWF